MDVRDPTEELSNEGWTFFLNKIFCSHGFAAWVGYAEWLCLFVLLAPSYGLRPPSKVFEFMMVAHYLKSRLYSGLYKGAARRTREQNGKAKPFRVANPGGEADREQHDLVTV